MSHKLGSLNSSMTALQDTNAHSHIYLFNYVFIACTHYTHIHTHTHTHTHTQMQGHLQHRLIIVMEFSK